MIGEREMKRLYIYKMPDVHSVNIRLCFKGGSLYENEENGGISHLIEHLHFRGLGKMRQKDLYKRLNRMGCFLHRVTYREFVMFDCNIHPKYFDEIIDIFRNIFEVEEWSEKDIESEKNVVLNQIADKEDYLYVSDEIDALLWKGTALGKKVIGTRENIERITGKEITEFKSWMKKTARLYIAGNVTEEMEEKVKGILPSDTEEYEAVAPLIKCNSDLSVTIAPWAVTDVAIAFCCSLKEFDEETLRMLTSIMGGGDGAFLQYRLIDEKALAVNAYAEFERVEDIGVIKVFLSAEKEKFGKALNECVKITESVKNLLTDDDLDENKVFFTDNRQFWKDSAEKVGFQMVMDNFVCGEEVKDVDEIVAGYEKVNLEDVKNAAERVFDIDKACVAVVGDVQRKDIKRFLE